MNRKPNPYAQRNPFKMKKARAPLFGLLAVLLSVSIALANSVPQFLSVTTRGQFSLAKPLSIKWQYFSEALLNNVKLVANKESVFIPLSGGIILSLSQRDGKLNWRAEIGGEIITTPVLDEHAVYLVSAPKDHKDKPPYEASLHAISLKTGITLWQKSIPSRIQTQLASNETTLFGLGTDGCIYANKKQDGHLVWKSQSEKTYTSVPLAEGNRLFSGHTDGSIHVLEQSSGKLLQRLRLGALVTIPPLVFNQTIIAGAINGYVYALSIIDGRTVWRKRTGGRILSLVDSAKGSLVTSSDNFAYLFEGRRGKLLWKRQLGGRVSASPATTLDEALFTPIAGDECVVLDLSTGKRINSIFVGDESIANVSPVISGRLLLLTTRRGIHAYTDDL